mgnify:FL=1
MSYILDALNKSDQDRQRERAPNLKTVHVSSRTGRSRNGWQVVIFLLLMINLLAFGVWLRAWMQEDSDQQVAEYENSVQEAVKAGEPIEKAVRAKASSQDEERTIDFQSISNDELAAVRPAGQPAMQPVVQPVVPPVVQPAVTPAPPQNLPEIHQLPTSTQRQIADLTFASHIYASSPRSRMVSINGRFMREGDRISANLVLRQITEEGVVLQYGDRVFQMSVLRDWSFE